MKKSLCTGILMFVNDFLYSLKCLQLIQYFLFNKDPLNMLLNYLYISSYSFFRNSALILCKITLYSSQAS